MKTALASVLLWAASGFALEQSDFYLKAGAHVGSPRGIGIQGRAVAGLFNVEAGANYGYFVNTFDVGAGFRFAIGERQELFLNLARDAIYSRNLDLNLSYAWSLEGQYERRFGRSGFSAFGGLGVALFPEDNELQIIYTWPVLRIGINRMIVGL